MIAVRGMSDRQGRDRFIFPGEGLFHGQHYAQRWVSVNEIVTCVLALPSHVVAPFGDSVRQRML